MIYLYFMSLFLLTMYIMYAVRVCGVPWSLSDTYYQLKKRNRPAWLFQIAMIVPAMLLMPVWIECSSENLQCLAFLACGGLMFVDALANIQDHEPNSLGLSLRYVVLACGCFPDSRCYHVEIPEMAVLGRDGSVCLCLCGGAYNLYRLLNREKWK